MAFRPVPRTHPRKSHVARRSARREDGRDHSESNHGHQPTRFAAQPEQHLGRRFRSGRLACRARRQQGRQARLVGGRTRGALGARSGRMGLAHARFVLRFRFVIPHVCRGKFRLGVRALRHRIRRLRADHRVQQLRQHQTRPPRRGTRVPNHFVGGDDVRRRHGHWPHVLRRGRTLDVLPRRHPRPQPSRSRHRDGADDVPLDAAPLGVVRGGWSRDRLFDVPHGPQAVAFVRVRPADRRQAC